jgi:hypothetical protein
LPNNTYKLLKGTTETECRYSVTGHKGDEKVVWGAYDGGKNNYNYIKDTLSADKEFVFPKDYYFNYCTVKHKDFKPITFGYTATAESKKIAVYEDIGLWRFDY